MCICIYVGVLEVSVQVMCECEEDRECVSKRG